MLVSFIKWTFLVIFFVSPITGYSQSLSAAKQTQNSATPVDQPKKISPTSLGTIPAQGPYYPITGKQRLEWFLFQTSRPESLLMGGFTAGIGTARDKPIEYGPHWSGFGERYGIRFSGVGTSNAMEASLGALWGEDPRYVRMGEGGFKKRMVNAFILTAKARNHSGQLMPAYARYIATSGNNFLSNTWRADSEANTHNALIRTGYGFLGRFASNAFAEFWPDIITHVLHREP